MLYNTGTIDINGNTATGTGTNWTAPASQIRVGQTLFVFLTRYRCFDHRHQQCDVTDGYACRVSGVERPEVRHSCY
uniref:hypothetical protein n=1 Tax=Enterobacter cloacae complex sp. 280C5 TaxID=3395861 RepID=UPI003CF385D9